MSYTSVKFLIQLNYFIKTIHFIAPRDAEVRSHIIIEERSIIRGCKRHFWLESCLKMLGRYFNICLIDNRFYSMLSILNQPTLQKDLHSFMTDNAFGTKK